MDAYVSSRESSGRHLVTLALGFHLFVLGTAKLGDGAEQATITILAGSITFNDPSVLAYFAWSMLAWYLIRFWQYSDHPEEWINCTWAMYHSKLMGKWLLKKGFQRQSEDYDEEQTYLPIFGTWSWPVAKSRSESATYEIGAFDVWKKVRLTLHIFIKTPYFGQYYFPYLIAFSAIYFGLEYLCE